MELVPVTPNLGVEVRDLDLADPLSEGIVIQLRRALLESGVLVFRGQSRLRRPDQVALAAVFGTPETAPIPSGDTPQVLTLRHDATTPPSENVWHSDSSFREVPTRGSVLRAVTLPPSGGDTVWVDMRLVYGSLPQGVKDLCLGRSAVHDIAKWAAENLRGSLHAAHPPRMQPMVRAHPETGEAILFVNEAYTTSIDGLDDADSAAVLAHLFHSLAVPEFQLRVRWEVDTVVVWDNRSLQHYAVGDYFPEVRVLERVTIAGEPVVAWGAAERA